MPIVERELRTAARRPGTYWLRLVVGLVAISITLTVVATVPSSLPPFMLAKLLFGLGSFVAFAFCLLSGVFLTSDCLSSERRDGTLGLLFLTSLRGYDVVLGKLAATSLQSVYALLAVLPILGLPLLVGGVTGGEFGRLLLVLVTTMVLSLGSSLAVSSFSREARQSIVLALLLTLGLCAWFPLLGLVERVLANRGVAYGFFLAASPWGAWVLSSDGSYQTADGASNFWTSIGLCWLATAAAVGGCCLWLPRIWRQTHSENAAGPRSSLWRRLRFSPPDRRWGRRAVFEANPFYWLAARDSLARWLIWLVLSLPGLLWVGGLLGVFALPASGGREMSLVVAFLAAYALHVLAKVVIALEASRRLSDDQQSGTLELLLVSPLPPALIARGQWLALVRHFRAPIAFLLLVNGALLWQLLGPNPAHAPVEVQGFFVSALVGGGLLLLLDFFALGWVGMQMGLRCRRHHRAVLATLVWVLLPPWLAILAMFLYLNLARGMNSSQMTVACQLWVGLGVLTSLWLGLRARSRVITGFRKLAMGWRTEIAR